MTSKKIKLAFILSDAKAWTGEVNYLKSLITSLRYIKKKNFKFTIFCSEEKKNYLKKYINIKHFYSSKYFENNSIQFFFRKIVKLIFKCDLVVNYYFKKKNINIVSHHDPIKKIKTISWIPDLQHLFYKNFFTGKEIIRRENLFKKYKNLSSSLIVSSHDTYRLFLKKYKPKKKNIYVLNFVPFINFEKINNFNKLKKKFSLEDNYIFIPNQFWKHKNHSILIKACIELVKKKSLYQFVISGNPSGNTDNSTYSSFINEINKYKLNNHFNILGFLPHQDVINLIYYSKVLINPSLFEGWSTTVEEGKIFKKQMLLSNLKVHKEQSSKNVIFFNPHNHVELSRKIALLMNKKLIITNKQKLKRIYINKRKKMAKNYFEIIKKTI